MYVWKEEEKTLKRAVKCSQEIICTTDQRHVIFSVMYSYSYMRSLFAWTKSTQEYIEFQCIYTKDTVLACLVDAMKIMLLLIIHYCVFNGLRQRLIKSTWRRFYGASSMNRNYTKLYGLCWSMKLHENEWISFINALKNRYTPWNCIFSIAQQTFILYLTDHLDNKPKFSANEVFFWGDTASRKKIATRLWFSAQISQDWSRFL